MDVTVIMKGSHLSTPVDVSYILLGSSVAYNACNTITRIVTHLFTDREDVMIIRNPGSAPEPLSTNVR